MDTQLRCRLAPEIFLIRERGLVSIGPNLEKSITGIANTLKPAPPAGAFAGCANALFTNACTSSFRMRDLGPEPLTLPSSTPSSRAKRRTEGLACACAKAASSTGARLGGDAGAGAGAGVATAAAALACEGAACALAELTGAAGELVAGAAAGGLAGPAAPSLVSTVRIGMPCDTLSPTLMRSSFTTPAKGAGTSMVALSLSNVTSESSALIASPAFTRTSMTGTSLKSPMSGTSTSLSAPNVISPCSLACSIVRRICPAAGRPQQHASHRWRVWLLAIDGVLIDRLVHN